MSRTIPNLKTLSRTIPYLNTLSRTISYLNTLSRTIPFLNTLSRTIPYPNTLSRTIPYLNTLSRIIPYLNTLRKNPNLTQNQLLVGSQSESSITAPKHTLSYYIAETYPILIHGWGTLLPPGHESAAMAYLKTWRVPPCLISSLSYFSHTSSANQNRARKNPSTSSANQNRVLRQPSCQPIGIEYYVTRELSARIEVPSRLSARVGSL